MAYTVKKGDTLSQIAKASKTTVQAIKDANPQITNVNVIKPGQVFNIPGSASTSTGLLDLTKPENAASARLQAQADAYFAANPQLDPLTGKPKTTSSEVSDDTDKKTNLPAPLTPPERTLASDTFRATLGLLFGATEAAKPYVTQLYGLVSNFYKTGSSVEEALNLALYQAENEKAIPEFTKRFAGLFSIRDMKQKGMAVTVPTIAEFFAAEAKMGEILTNAGLGDLATEDFLGGVIGQNKSVLEVGNLISDVFTSIDYAPTELKTTLQTFFPGVDRTAIAKAILTGKEGAQELSQKVKGISVLSAAQQQGVKMDLPTATNIAKQGYDYQQALTGFGQVKRLERADTLAQFTGGSFTATQAQNAVFGKSIKEQMTIEELAKQEEARFQGSSGRFASKDRAAGQI
jgi:LysM repeat protein